MGLSLICLQEKVIVVQIENMPYHLPVCKRFRTTVEKRCTSSHYF